MNKRLIRIISILCMIVMVLSCSSIAFAEETATQEDAETMTLQDETPETEEALPQEETEEPEEHVHKWSAWKTTKKATYYAGGKQKRTCLSEDCDAYETRSTAKLPKKSVWIRWNGKYYYYNSKGNRVHGWNCLRGMSKTSPKKWYYFNDKGAVVKSVSATIKNTWVRADGKKYFFTAESKPVRDGVPYYNYRYGTYALIDISKQKLYLYKDKKKTLTAPVITGLKGKHDTPTGTFNLFVKKRDVWLVGATWCSHVDYWMQFLSGGYGIHDASWRTSTEFKDSKRYIKDGSHGCVNMRYADAKKVYFTLKTGDTVIIRK